MHFIFNNLQNLFLGLKSNLTLCLERNETNEISTKFQKYSWRYQAFPRKLLTDPTCNFPLTSNVAKFRFWCHKMLNVLKRMQIFFFDFSKTNFVQPIFYFWDMKRFYDKKFRRKHLFCSNFDKTRICIRFS